MVYTIDEIKEKVAPIAQKYNLSKVYLFGSYARGEADDASDVDLVIEPTEATVFDWGTIGIKHSFEDSLSSPVDCLIVDMMEEPTTYISKLVSDRFYKERVLVYENESVGS